MKKPPCVLLLIGYVMVLAFFLAAVSRMKTAREVAVVTTSEEASSSVTDDSTMFRMFPISEAESDPCSDPFVAEICFYKIGHSDPDPIDTIIDSRVQVGWTELD